MLGIGRALWYSSLAYWGEALQRASSALCFRCLNTTIFVETLKMRIYTTAINVTLYFVKIAQCQLKAIQKRRRVPRAPGPSYAVYGVYKRLLGISRNRPALGVRQFAPHWIPVGQGVAAASGSAPILPPLIWAVLPPNQLMTGKQQQPSHAGAKRTSSSCASSAAFMMST